MSRDDRQAVLRELAAFAKECAGDAAQIELSSHHESALDFLEITPTRDGARAIAIIAEQWLVVQVGDIGGRFELDWSPGDVATAKEIIAGVIDGRVTERFGRNRSVVVVSVPNGEEHAEVGVEGCLAALIPQPGWRRWGRLRTYAPYRSVAG